MRKVLLASATIVVLCSPSAMAADVLITSEVEEACTVLSTDPTATLPSSGAISDAVNFSWSCNYSVGTATLTFESDEGGVTDGSATYEYDINPSTGSSGTSAAAFDNTPSVDPTPNEPVLSTLTLQLDGGSPILIAGTYTDTLHITIAP